MSQTYFIIYETINLVNGMKYRGCHRTKNIDDGYLGSGKLLSLAIKKYSTENFKRVVLEYCNSVEHMFEREAWWVDDEWVAREDTYNVTTGGKGRRGLSEEGKIAIAKANKTRMTDATKKKISESIRKTHSTPEMKKKISENTQKALLMPGMREKLATNKDKKASEETKRKRSESIKKTLAEKKAKGIVGKQKRVRKR